MHQLARHGGLHVFRVFHRRIDPSAPWRFPEHYDLALLSRADAVAQCGDPALELSEASVRAAYERGGACIGAWRGAQLAGYVWFAFDTAPHLQGVWVEVPPHAIYRYKAFVRPEHRGKGLAPGLYRFADRVFADRGREVVVNCIATHNVLSIAASRRSGAQPLGYLGYWLRGERYVSFHSRAVRRFGLRFCRDRR